MTYIIAFLEGIITFISPCLLPMLPIYISYFAGSSSDKRKSTTLKNALGFVLGFTTVFIFLGIFAGTLGSFLTRYQTVLNIISGLIVIVFGLNFIGILRISLLNKTSRIQTNLDNLNFLSSAIFGIAFSIGWTPCVGAFLGSALMLVSQQGSLVKGLLMMICYSIGLGIPFIITAVLIERLETTFDFIKKHYRIINVISGIFLIIIGILMMTGYMNYFLSLLTF